MQMDLRKALLRGGLFFSVFAAVALKLYPELTLRIPTHGFKFYAMLGGSVPPYITNKAWENQHLWERPGDVVVVVPSKSGTTWLLHTVHSIRTKGDVNYDDILVEVPWLELTRYPGETLATRISSYFNTSSHYPYRAFKSHVHPPVLKVSEKMKFVVGFRNPIDAVSSLVDFLSTSNEAFSKVWGGFPPKDMGSSRFQWIEGIYDEMWIQFVKGWWPYRHYPNVHFLHYKDRVTDPRGDIASIANFLDTQLSEEEFDRVVKYSSFEWMKNHSRKFEGCTVARSVLPENVCILVHEGMLAKGQKRKGSSELPQDMVERLQAKTERELGPEISKWFREGGPVPFDAELPTASKLRASQSKVEKEVTLDRNGKPFYRDFL